MFSTSKQLKKADGEITENEFTSQKATQTIGGMINVTAEEENFKKETVSEDIQEKGTFGTGNTEKEANEIIKFIKRSAEGTLEDAIEKQVTPRKATAMEFTSDEATLDQDTLPMLTLFTTFSQNESKRHIFQNTLRIWSLLEPWIHPVLYCPDEECESRWNKSISSGWAIPRATRVNKHNIPVLRLVI